MASAQASLRLAQANFERNQRLVAQNYVSSLTLDQSRRELDVLARREVEARRRPDKPTRGVHR